MNLADRRPEALQYLGASFGVTAPLLGFWQRAGYLPVYLRQTPSEVSSDFDALFRFCKGTCTKRTTPIPCTWQNYSQRHFM